MERRLLITGMGGTIGRQLTAVAMEQGFKVFGTVRNFVPPEIVTLADQRQVTVFATDLRERQQVQQVVSIARPDVIVNLAGYPHSDPFLGRAVFDENMAILNNLISSVLSLEKGRNRFSTPVTFVQTGTIWQYGQNLGEIPITEVPFYEMPNQDSNFYTQSKVEAEKVLQAFYKEGFGISPIFLRLAHHTGEGKKAGMTALAANEVLRVKDGKDDCIRIRNKIGRIDLSDAYDGARAMAYLIQHGIPGEAYNIARGEHNTIEEVLTIMSQRANLPPSVGIVSTGEEIPTHARFNISKLLSTGFRPVYSFRQTIERFFDWYCQKDMKYQMSSEQSGQDYRKVAFV